MTPDKLITGFITHLKPESLLEAQENGTLIPYYAELAQKICGSDQTAAGTTTQTRNRRTAAVAVEAVGGQERTEVRVRTTTARPAANPTRRNDTAGDDGETAPPRNTGRNTATTGRRDAVRVRAI